MSSTLSGPFLEENDVCRRAVKPPHAEVQSHDGQTQRTEQALATFATVRTGYTASALAEETSNFLDYNTSPPSKKLTCYNKFLINNQLPTLPPNQSLQTFLKHLQKNLFYKPFKISYNNTNSETHVYENINLGILPNHTLLSPQQYHLYYNSPIRTETPQIHNIPSTTHDLHLTIATHNVRGFNNPTKRETWESYCLNHNISIASLTETKISNNTNLRFCNNNLFTYYWANSENSAEGTAIMIQNYLKPHVHSCTIHPGGAIALDFFFKGNIKLRIISVYLSSTDTSKRTLTQNKVINWIQQAHQQNLHPIILGDFNTHDNISSSSTKFKLINYLNHSNMYDIGAHFNNTHYTWSNQNSMSRIDYIWTDQFNIQFLLSYKLDSSTTSTLSDHLILMSNWTFSNAYSKPLRKHTNISRRIFNYKAMTNEKWLEYNELTAQLISQNNTPLDTQTDESIECTWHKIQCSILSAATKIIPNRITRKRSYNHQFTSHHTTLYLSLKKLGHLIKTVKQANNSSLNISNINSQITTINSNSQCNINNLISLEPVDIHTWLQDANQAWKQLYNARQLQNSLLLRQQINDASEKRCQTLTTRPTQAINSILNRYTPPIHFSNIKLQDQLITEPKFIKAHIKNHFEKWTAYKPINETLFNSTWQQQYEPISSINSNWYKPLIDPISQDEVLLTINSLPNGKACGPTGISYEMIKHSSSTLISAITALFNRCFLSQHIPKQWKNSRIYPIPKKNSFDGDLNLTRPISLIEHIRKLYTKILTNRFNKVFSQHPILSPFNYVALPGNSTSIPIHILNNLIEDANCNHKNIWIMSQDMSKAYDSVNLELFHRSLKRLALPPLIINILIDLLSNRQNQVITNLGLTSPYQVNNGIDQGETITPLFWRIYYDPLISHIYSNNTGYTMQTSWITNLKNKSYSKLKTHCSVVAYMDDTLWIASSQAELSHILTTAESFYSMANIQVNPSKSLLCTNNPPPNYTPIYYNNHPLPLHPSKQPFKFLGCWFTLNNKQSKQIQLIISESAQLIKIAKTKQITETQARYIINTVIIPTIEYRIQNIVLSQNTCNKILTQHISLVKHKAKLSRTIPTSSLIHPQIYNVKHIWDIQLQHHISNFLKRLNNPSLVGTSTRIRLQQLQNNLWSSISILAHLNPIIDGHNKHTTNFKITQLISHIGWSVSPNLNHNIPFTITEKSTTLESILSIHPKYNTFKKQLRNHKILFLAQLTSFDNSCLLHWKHISPKLNKIPKGRKPLWFSTLEEITINHLDDRTLHSHYNLSKINYYSFTTGHFNTRSKPWLIAPFRDQIIIGKARRQPTPSGHTLITHWQYNMQTQSSKLYPTPDINSFQCSNCSLNSNLITQKCTILIPTNLATKFLGRINPSDKSIKFNANFLDLISSISIRHPSTTPPLPKLQISTIEIPPIFKSNSLTNTLQTIINTNSHLSELSFYTDGSVTNLGNSQCSMGIGWVQIDSGTVLNTFQAQIQYWPCSFKAELVAILSAITTAPRNSNIKIYTDSQSVISKYDNIINSPISLQQTKITYSDIWNTLINIIQSYNLNIEFYKVQAHQNDEFNNRADQLARDHYNLPYLTFIPKNIYNNNYTCFTDNYHIELPIRRCIRTICQAHIYALWSSQNRFQQWTEISTKIDWQATWLYINNNQKISNFSHSFQSSTLKSFRVKLLLDDLPTPHILHKRNSSYPNICHQCNQTSTSLHWVTCPSPQLLNNLITNSLSTILKPSTLNISQNTVFNLHQQIINLDSLQTHNFSYKPSLTSTLTGLIPLEIILLLKEITESQKIATSLTIKLLLHLNKQIYTQIWIPYCISRSQITTLPTPLSSLPITNISQTSGLNLHLITRKITTWYPQWIEYQVHPSNIITQNQI
jgi:ribonuclease HI